MMRTSAHTVLAIAFLTTFGCREEQKKADPPPPMTVYWVKPTSNPVTEFEEFTGRTAATKVNELRARVSGYLARIDFEDGAHVEKDEVLFKIDDRPFVAEEQRTGAVVNQFEARIKRLTSQLQRAQELLERNAMSQNEFDTAKYDLEEATANLAEARAAHELAILNVQFTTIKAPLNGRIGRRLLDVGNLVMADQTSLATIVPQDQVYVDFDMDERTVLKIRRTADPAVVTQGKDSNVTVDIALADAPEFSLHGRVDFLDNQIDSATGTLRARATVDNSDGLLSPGLFVRLRYPIGQPLQSLLIPEEAMASDQGRPFVFVVGVGVGDHAGMPVALARDVQPGPLVGSQRVIRSGVNSDDRVIVTGLQRLRNGMLIKPEKKPGQEVSTEGKPKVEAALPKSDSANSHSESKKSDS